MIENIKKNQIEMLELKNIITNIKNSLDVINGRIKTEERISELNNRIELTESEQ